ncbi:hypothetical protein [Sorangium cellulosum]|uniref:PEGA domain-containing protein n=1 Tax=Sorangium cellulosum TaxID=56 RepID=A0A150QZ34_SORCE|nr:hypothetical protein [Sorangium cellulosum]KYF73131.1 hypothetical protein BE15_04010 [Sorangium cellulosum]
MTARDMAATAALVFLSTLGACERPGVEDDRPEPGTEAADAAEVHPPTTARPGVHRLGAGERRVKLLVLPADAAVEIDGVPARRRDGVIELSGRVGQTHRVRLSRDTRHAETIVTLMDGGVSPPSLDLAALARAARPFGRGRLPTASTAEPAAAEADASALELAETPELAPEPVLPGVAAEYDAPADRAAMESAPDSAPGAVRSSARGNEGSACVCPPSTQVIPRCPTGAAAAAEHRKQRSGVLAGDAFE